MGLFSLRTRSGGWFRPLFQPARTLTIPASDDHGAFYGPAFPPEVTRKGGTAAFCRAAVILSFRYFLEILKTALSVHWGHFTRPTVARINKNGPLPTRKRPTDKMLVLGGFDGNEVGDSGWHDYQ